jgi:hypothetical protein
VFLLSKFEDLMMSTTLVTGDIVLPSDARNFKDATVYIRLEKVGMMGMPAEIVSEQVLNNVTYDGDAIGFSLDGQVPEDGKYNLRVHVSKDGSDDFSKGDFITKRTHHVLKNGAPETGVRVELEEV